MWGHPTSMRAYADCPVEFMLTFAFPSSLGPGTYEAVGAFDG